MKFNRSRLWIIILGGVLGLVLGVVGAHFSLGERWERLSYPVLASTNDRAIELSGYDSYDGTLYVKGQSQTIYGCPAELYRENSDCHRMATEAIPRFASCPGPAIRRFDDPPGKVISKLIVFDCRYNEYITVQTNYVLLDDGSLLKWTYNSLGEGFGNCLIIPGAIFGMVLGLVIGVMLAATRKQPRSSA
jgi:hypothetical protein